MPEGHTVHRLARDHATLLAGHPLRSASPQGRFGEGAAVVDGRVLERIEAYGKHLLYGFGDVAVHVHLGLYGTFTTHRPLAPPPGPNVRWRFGAGDVTVDLVGPTACELYGPAEIAALRARLGPDPLRRDGRAERFFDALGRRRTPIGAALLDQTLIAGIGNVFRAEALFLCGIHPDRPAQALTQDECRALWDTLRQLLRRGVRENRIATVPPRERDRREPDGRGRHRYVYHRTGLPCRVCGTPIVEWPLAARRIFACPRCQPH
jgi:endonuclease-8